MLKMVFLVHKKADLNSDDFRRYWRETHGPIAAKIPGLKKYVQNHSVPGPDGADPPYDGFAEMWFESAESLETSQAQTAIADTANFLDLDRMQSFVVEEVNVV